MGVADGVELWVGVFGAVLVGEGVGLLVGAGLNVFDGSGDGSGVDVIVITRPVGLLSVTVAVLPAVFVVPSPTVATGGGSVLGSANGSHAEAINVIMVVRKTRLLILLKGFGIESSKKRWIVVSQ